MSYQERDHEIIDYEIFRLPGTGDLRGPQPRTLAPGEYFTCVGAAQTFGCFCEQPYPALLAERLDLPALNFGFAGAGPRFFYPALIDYINAGRFAVVQVMSGRSEDNSVFESGGREYLRRRSDGERIGAEPAYRELLEQEGPERMLALVEETRQNWVESFRKLLDAISVPKVLLWFARRGTDYHERYDDIFNVFGDFPHLVTTVMVEQIKPFSDAYVECVTERGFPQRLVSRFTGKPVPIAQRSDLGYVWQGVDPYYPSPEMHEDAAEALTPVSRKHAGKPEEDAVLSRSEPPQ
jgi:hypothetical protein